MKPLKGYWSVKQAAKAWGVTPRYVRMLLKGSPIQGMKKDSSNHLFIPTGSAKPQFRSDKNLHDNDDGQIRHDLHEDWLTSPGASSICGSFICQLFSQLGRSSSLSPQQMDEIIATDNLTTQTGQKLPCRDLATLLALKDFVLDCVSRHAGPICPSMVARLTPFIPSPYQTKIRQLGKLQHDEDPDTELAKYLFQFYSVFEHHFLQAMVLTQLLVFAQCVHRNTMPLSLLQNSKIVYAALARREPLEKMLCNISLWRSRSPLYKRPLGGTSI